METRSRFKTTLISDSIKGREPRDARRASLFDSRVEARTFIDHKNYRLFTVSLDHEPGDHVYVCERG